MQGIGKNDDQHMYLRRLKMIYNTRKQWYSGLEDDLLAINDILQLIA